MTLDAVLQDITKDLAGIYKRLDDIALTGTQVIGGLIPAAGTIYNHLEDDGAAWVSVPSLTLADDAFLNLGPAGGSLEYDAANARVQVASAPWLFDQVRLLIDGSGAAPASPDGPLHVHAASAGVVTASISADEGIFENSTDGGISILTPATSTGAVYFGSPTSAARGWLSYDHSADGLLFGVVGNTDFTMTTNSFNVLSSSFITMADDTWIGLGPTAGRLVFDDQATDEIIFQYCNVLIDPGAGLASPDGTLHVHTTSAGAVAASGDANDFTIEGYNTGGETAWTGMSILTPATGIGTIFWGRPGRPDAGRIIYDHGNEIMRFYTASTLAITISSAQLVSLTGNLSMGGECCLS